MSLRQFSQKLIMLAAGLLLALPLHAGEVPSPVIPKAKAKAKNKSKPKSKTTKESSPSKPRKIKKEKKAKPKTKEKPKIKSTSKKEESKKGEEDVEIIEEEIEEEEEEEEEEYIVKQKPELTPEIKKQLRFRSDSKKKKPHFKRQEWFRYKRLGDSWRKPRVAGEMTRHLRRARSSGG